MWRISSCFPQWLGKQPALGLDCSYFLSFLQWERRLSDLPLFFFSIINISYYKFPSQHYFSCILCILICCIFTLIRFYLFSNIFELPLRPMDYFKMCCLISIHLDIFLLSFCYPVWFWYSGRTVCMISLLWNLLRAVFLPRI